jgi:hypothetical protein
LLASARASWQFGATDLVIGPPGTPVMGGLAGPEVRVRHAPHRAFF